MKDCFSYYVAVAATAAHEGDGSENVEVFGEMRNWRFGIITATVLFCLEVEVGDTRGDTYRESWNKVVPGSKAVSYNIYSNTEVPKLF